MNLFIASPSALPSRMRGFTLLELMISMLLGLLVLIGITTLVMNTGKANREQASIARLQENGRFALNRIAADLRMAGAQYCGSFSNEPGSANFGHKLRPIMLRTPATLPWGLPGIATLGTNYLSPRFFIQGHECTTVATCQPALNVLGAATPVPPATGTAAAMRSAAADVLTVRYLRGAGESLIASHAPGSGSLQLGVSPTAAPLNLTAGNLALVTDCRNAEVFPATVSGNSVVPPLPDPLKAYPVTQDPRVLNFTNDMVTVTYFLRMRANADGGSSIPTLARQQNGQIQNIADGVERLEFLYGVRTTVGGVPAMHYLNARQVQNGVSAAGGALACSPQPQGVPTLEPGCLWRQVETIDVALLVNTVNNVSANSNDFFSFSAAEPPIVDQPVPATLPSGLPSGRMFRKEFRTRVNVRSFTH